LTILLPAPGQRESWLIEDFDGARVVRLSAPRTKDISYVRRTVAELLMPFAMLHNLQRSPLANEVWDGVVWYAPSIFHGPLAAAIKKRSHCKGYLIIRDIFPEWAADMGLMGRGLPYRFFRAVARFQYSVADVIGVQTRGNLGYFQQWKEDAGRSLEVLENWLGKSAQRRCSIRLDASRLAGRKIFVYAGNMGVAQGMDILLDLAESLLSRPDLGFAFVGRGSEANRLAELARVRGLSNVQFFDEIDPDEIPDLYAQCHVGIVALDPRHRTHNIPGKFLTYMQSGLPVLACVNPGNDMAELIRMEGVGEVVENQSLHQLRHAAEVLAANTESREDVANPCVDLFRRRFSVVAAAEQVANALNSGRG
jgi:glycosyltransferase involved in cell wall biosynthesis